MFGLKNSRMDERDDQKVAGICNVALNLAATGKIPAAIAMYRRAAAMDPRDVRPRLQLANVLVDEGRIEEAAAVIDGVAPATPLDTALACMVGGFIAYARGDRETMVKAFITADAVDPDRARMRLAQSAGLLMTGDWEQGWEAYEIVHQMYGTAPRWDGSRVKRLLVVADQGVGDIIHFARYVPWAAKQADRVYFAVPVGLAALLQGYGQCATVIVGDIKQGAPLAINGEAVELDAQIGLSHLARLHGSRPDNVPKDPGLLRLDPIDGMPPRRTGRLRVGIAWAGNPSYLRDRQRSMPLDAMLGLAADPNIDLFSLQMGARAGDIATTGAQPIVTDLSGRIAIGWAGTGFAVKHMDAIVSVDTAVAHLGGALGVPTFICLPFFPDWRWLLDRDDSVWYPSARLVRQTRHGDWAGVIERVREGLRGIR